MPAFHVTQSTAQTFTVTYQVAQDLNPHSSSDLLTCNSSSLPLPQPAGLLAVPQRASPTTTPRPLRLLFFVSGHSHITSVRLLFFICEMNLICILQRKLPMLIKWNRLSG